MADEPKWTPGPWAVERNKRTWGWVDVVGPSLGVGGPTQATDLTLADEVKRIAEAHLIAAAPDLYAALDDLLASYAEPDQQICCGGHDCGCRGASVRDLAEHHARAAIAKARGAA